MANLGYGSALKPARSVDYEALKRNGFRDQGILIVHIDDPRLAWQDKELLRQLGERLYGKKDGG